MERNAGVRKEMGRETYVPAKERERRQVILSEIHPKTPRKQLNLSDRLPGLNHRTQREKTAYRAQDCRESVRSVSYNSNHIVDSVAPLNPNRVPFMSKDQQTQTIPRRRYAKVNKPTPDKP